MIEYIRGKWQGVLNRSRMFDWTVQNRSVFNTDVNEILEKTYHLRDSLGNVLANGVAVDNQFVVFRVDNNGKAINEMVKARQLRLFDMKKSQGFASKEQEYQVAQYDEETSLLVLSLQVSSEGRVSKGLKTLKSSLAFGDEIVLIGKDKNGQQVLRTGHVIEPKAVFINNLYKEDEGIAAPLHSFAHTVQDKDLLGVPQIALDRDGNLLGLCSGLNNSVCFQPPQMGFVANRLAEKGTLAKTKWGGSVKTSAEKEGTARLRKASM